MQQPRRDTPDKGASHSRNQLTGSRRPLSNLISAQWSDPREDRPAHRPSAGSGSLRGPTERPGFSRSRSIAPHHRHEGGGGAVVLGTIWVQQLDTKPNSPFSNWTRYQFGTVPTSIAWSPGRGRPTLALCADAFRAHVPRQEQPARSQQRRQDPLDHEDVQLPRHTARHQTHGRNEAGSDARGHARKPAPVQSDLGDPGPEQGRRSGLRRSDAHPPVSR
jgi:hypothetical protein